MLGTLPQLKGSFEEESLFEEIKGTLVGNKLKSYLEKNKGHLCFTWLEKRRREVIYRITSLII